MHGGSLEALRVTRREAVGLRADSKSRRFPSSFHGFAAFFAKIRANATDAYACRIVPFTRSSDGTSLRGIFEPVSRARSEGDTGPAPRRRQLVRRPRA